MPDPASSPVLPVPRPEGERVADWADSGVTALTGRADGPVLVPSGWGASVARELASLLPVDVDGPALLAERAAFTGGTRRGAVSVGGACRLLPTADGWAAVSCARPDDPALLGALSGTQIDSDPWPAVSAWLRDHPGAELAERAALLSLAAAPVRALPDVRSENPESAAYGRTAALRSAGIQSAALQSAALQSAALQSAALQSAALQSAGPWPVALWPVALRSAFAWPGPIRSADGLRVVDFSALWAGPLCAHLLGLAGADVIKVETPDRPDGARRGHSGFYRLLHAGHRSVVLDPATPRGRDALAALVASAGIVIEASRPRALARWGLDPAKTPATWISITAAGRTSDRVGFGDDVAAGAGLVAWDGDGPVFAGDAIADPLSGLIAAVRALTDPPGSLIGISMTDVVAGTLAGPVDGPLGAPLAGPVAGSLAGPADGPRDGMRVFPRESLPSGAPTTVGATVAGRARPPRARTPAGEAPPSGADTDSVLSEL